MHLLCPPIKCASTMCHGRFSSLFRLARVFSFPVPTNPSMHCSRETTPSQSFRENNLDDFFFVLSFLVFNNSEHAWD